MGPTATIGPPGAVLGATLAGGTMAPDGSADAGGSADADGPGSDAVGVVVGVGPVEPGVDVGPVPGLDAGSCPLPGMPLARGA